MKAGLLPFCALLGVLVVLPAAESAPADAPVPIPAWQRTEGKLEARVGAHLGRQVIFVNGKPVAPQMYSGTEHSRQTWTGLARRS